MHGQIHLEILLTSVHSSDKLDAVSSQKNKHKHSNNIFQHNDAHCIPWLIFFSE
jgi:hypothetical protein